MAALIDVLTQIRTRESSNCGGYSCRPNQNVGYPASHASGAYQFEPGTWRQWSRVSGFGTQYAEAYQAPPDVQDAVAAYAALHGPGVNSTALWGASAPAGGYPAITSGTEIALGPDGLPVIDPGGSASIGNIVSGLTGGGGLLSGIENWFVRGFLIALGIVILAIGLMHLMDPSGGKTAALLAA